MGTLLQTQVKTKDGEIVVTINLNLTIKTDGTVSVETEPRIEDVVNKIKYEMPKIEDNDILLDNFGMESK